MAEAWPWPRASRSSQSLHVRNVRLRRQERHDFRCEVLSLATESSQV